MEPIRAVSQVTIDPALSVEDAPGMHRAVEAGAENITKAILDAIAGCKSALMLRIGCLTTECTLIRHDKDKFRGRLNEAEDRIGTVEDVQGFHVAQLADL